MLGVIEQCLPTFLAPCIVCIDRLCDSCALRDINQRLSLHYSRWFQNFDLLWRNRHMSRPLAIVTSQWPFVLAGFLLAAFLSKWRWDQCFKEFVKYTSVPSFSNFILERICVSVNCLASSDIIINWLRATRTTWSMALIILQWRDSMRITYGFSIELIRNLIRGEPELCQLICKSW